MMKFKPLDLKPEGSWWKRFWSSPHVKKTILYVLIGMAGGAVLFFISDAGSTLQSNYKDLISNVVMGGLFGWFITNSPCARGRC